MCLCLPLFSPCREPPDSHWVTQGGTGLTGVPGVWWCRRWRWLSLTLGANSSSRTLIHWLLCPSSHTWRKALRLLGLELSPRSPPGSTPMTTQRSSPWVLPVPFRNTYNITQLTLCFALSVNYPCHWNISSARAGHCLFCSLSFPYLPALHWHPDVSLIALFNKYERNHKCYKYLLWEIRVCYFGLNRSWT